MSNKNTKHTIKTIKTQINETTKYGADVKCNKCYLVHIVQLSDSISLSDNMKSQSVLLQIRPSSI